MAGPHSSYPTLGAPPTQRLLFARVVDNQEGLSVLLSLTLSSSQVAGKVEVNSASVLEELVFLKKPPYGSVCVWDLPWGINRDHPGNDAFPLLGGWWLVYSLKCSQAPVVVLSAFNRWWLFLPQRSSVVKSSSLNGSLRAKSLHRAWGVSTDAVRDDRASWMGRGCDSE